MGIYYNPPPPPTANNAGTPPEPHVGIASSGAQPPRYKTALMLVAVMASWPADLEPRLARPNDQRQKIAPLTLTYGQQPPRATITARMAVAASSWPADLEPRLARPNDQRQKIAPLTLTYGQPPPIRSGIAPPTLTHIIAAWAQSWDAQTAPKNAGWNVPPVETRVPYAAVPRPIWVAWELPWQAPPAPTAVVVRTLPAGEAPPIIGTTVQARTALLVAQWPADLEPRLGLPNNRQTAIAPLTRVYGDAPAIVGTTGIAKATIVASWPADLEPRLSRPNDQRQKIVPLTLTYGAAPPVLGARVPLAVVGAWPPDLEPRLTAPNNVRVSVAPRTLSYGSQPSPQAALSVPKLTQIVAAWAQTWDAQTAPKNAAWNIPPPSKVPKSPLPTALWTAWEPPWMAPPAPVAVVVRTLPVGDQPRRGREQQIAAAAAWATEFASSAAPRPAAGWAASLVRVPRTTTPLAIRNAWDDVFVLPPGVAPGSRGSIAGALTMAAAGTAHGSSTAVAVSLRLLETTTISGVTRRSIPNMSREPGRAAKLWALRRTTRLFIETGDWRI